MSPIPDIDLRQVRPHGNPATRAIGFEELTSAVIRVVREWPDGTRFERFGNPDGGREGRGVLPDGSVWAWQAKYLFSFDAAAASQVETSIKRAIEREPRLTRYLVCLPIDLPAGDTDDRLSAHTRWETKVTAWEKLASEAGLTVDFEFIGEHQLVSALSRAGNEGRARYWFNADVLGEEVQRRQIEDEVARARDRYDADLHVDVAPMGALDGLTRSERHVALWREGLAGLRGSRRNGWRNPTSATDEGFQPLDDAIEAVSAAVEELDAALACRIAALSEALAPAAVDDGIAAVRRALTVLEEHLRTHRLGDGGVYHDADASLVRAVRATSSAVRDIEALDRSAGARGSIERFLLITGRGGTGKTHLLCRVAEERTERGLPTLLLLGQRFESQSPFDEMATLAGYDGGGHDMLRVLDAAGEAAGGLALLMIDAINETSVERAWGEDLGVLRRAVDRYPNVAVAVSCRTEFLDGLVEEDIQPRAEHRGFGRSADAALERYCDHYGIDRPTIPPLNPELSNPLFLKLLCRSLSSLERTQFPPTGDGLSSATDLFITAANQALAVSNRCDFDPLSNLVELALRRAVALEGPHLARDAVAAICDDLLPGRRFSESLLKGLLTEGLLIEVGTDRLAFGYQRLGDTLHAQTISAGGVDAVRTWMAELGREYWSTRGTLAALAMVVPEEHGVEVLDLDADAEGRVSLDVIDAFLSGLPLRASASITERTIRAVSRALETDDFGDETWEVLLCLAAIPDHPLNGDLLHNILSARPLPDRDQTWSQHLTDAFEYPRSNAAVLIDWAWPASGGAPAAADEVRRLVLTSLGWMLTTTDRAVRDRATKAIVNLATGHEDALAALLARLGGVDDPYVVERLAGAACGAAYRTTDSAAVMLLAEAVTALVRDSDTHHILTLDYAKHVQRCAKQEGWGHGAAEHEAADPLTTEPRSEDAIEALVGEDESRLASIWYSLTGLGDFGKYVVGPAMRNFADRPDTTLTPWAIRMVFDRVLDLGWTTERFGTIDAGRSGHVPMVERVGKKYQWIALYELLGRLAAVHSVGESWGKDRAPYTSAEQVVWRDIDPTVLARTGGEPPAGRDGQPWHAAVESPLPTDVVDQPSDALDTAGIPLPAELIRSQDDDRSDWLRLAGRVRRTETVPAEDVPLDLPRMEVSCWTTAVVTETTSLEALLEWAEAATSDQLRHLTDPWEPHSLLLGAAPDGPGWEHLADEVDAEWVGFDADAITVWPAAIWYGGTGTSRDASTDEPATGWIPSPKLIEALGLVHHVDFDWWDDHGQLLVRDPVEYGGPPALLLREQATARLAEAGLTLLWVVHGHKQRFNTGTFARTHDDEPYRWVEVRAVVHKVGDDLKTETSDAARFQQGPEREHELNWTG